MVPRTATPSELTSDSNDTPRRLRVASERAVAYASRLELRHRGPDFEIDCFRPLSTLNGDGNPLTYLSSKRYQAALQGRRGLTVVTTPELQSCVPPGNGVVLTDQDPRSAFYSIMKSAQELGLFECVESFVSASAKVSPTAVVSSNVYVADRAEIGHGAVILPNSYIGPGVVVKPNAVIGGDGFEVMGVAANSGDRRKIVPHVGGVWLAEGVQVGSCSCIDKGLFGDFTMVGSHTLIDNLVHFAHSARAGKGCSIIACAEISGSVVMGDGVWVGPNASINQGLKIGDHAYIGTGSVVTRDLDAHSLAYGSPAKVAAQVCECRAKLSFANGHCACTACGREYVLTDGKVRRA